MATLYAYPLGTPKTNDLIIGTSVPLPQLITTDEQSTTVNFTVASIIAMVTTATGAQSFQQVTNIDQTTIGADLVSVTTNNVQITGILYDSANAKGTLGQVLTASALGKTVWATDTSGVTSLTTTDGTWIDLTPNAPATGAVTVTADLSAADGSAVAGTRFLSKDNTWAIPVAGVTSFTNANGTFISAGTQNAAATGAVTVGTLDLSATGTKDATTFLRGDNTWNVPVGAVTSVTTTDGTYIDLTPNAPATGAVTVTADLNAVDGTAVALTRFLSKDNTWDVPAYTVEADTLQTVCARGSTTSTSITMNGSGAAGYLYVTGNAGNPVTNPVHTQGFAFAYNNSGGSRECEIFWNTGTTTVSNNNASYLGFYNEFLNSDAGDARVSDLQLKLYGTGELGLTGVTPTISNTYWRMPTSAAPNTGYYLAKDAATTNLIWTQPSVSILNHSGVPASASATGTAGTMRWDADYIYVCIATDTWKRVAIATW